MMKPLMTSGLLMIFSLLIGVWGQTSSPPEIVFIDFPNQIQADGSKVSGFVGFKDPDGDLARAEFAVVQAKDFQPFTVDLKNLKGVKEGVFEFQIATQTPQRVVLQVVLVDEAGNRSTPKEFWFEAVGPGQPPPQQPTVPSPLGLVIEPSDKISTEIRTDRVVYQTGQDIRIFYKISTAVQLHAYAYVFDIMANGNVQMIFPNCFSQDPTVSANIEQTLPDKSTYRFVVTPPLGKEYVQIIASLEAIDLAVLGVASFSPCFGLIGRTPQEARTKLELRLKEG